MEGGGEGTRLPIGSSVAQSLVSFLRHAAIQAVPILCLITLVSHNSSERALPF